HQHDPVTDSGVTIGKRYGYMGSWFMDGVNGERRMAAIGLLSRSLLGTPTSHAAFDDFRNGLYSPVANEMYFNFHATLLMYRMGGTAWQQWNTEMQDLLLPLQATAASGHAEGSWLFNGGDHNGHACGGRLYGTVTSLLCLEAYFSGLKLDQ
ncbi:MAG: hypothetical protein WBF93_14305, partial [Pirellulales bacterium]